MYLRIETENKKLQDEIELGKTEKPRNFELPSSAFFQASPKEVKSKVSEAQIDRKIEDLLERKPIVLDNKSYIFSVTFLKSNYILITLSKFSIENDIDYMILGETRLQNEKDSVIFKLRKELGATKTQIEVVPLKSN